MQKITSTTGLKNAIQLLEAEQAVNQLQLKEQFQITYSGFKPVNLIKNSLNDIATSPYLIDNILNTAIGLATGSLSKKIFVGTSGNMVRRLVGSVLQFGVINFVALHHDEIRTFSQFLFKHFLHKKEANSKMP